MLKFVSILSCVWLALTGIVPVSDAAQDDRVIVGDIQFTIEKNGTERVCFVLNRFCIPTIFSLEGSKPRIVIDIKDVSSWSGKSRIPASGILIRQVRRYFHRDQNKLRIVLDLNPSMHYVAKPVYYEAEGLFCIAVGAE